MTFGAPAVTGRVPFLDASRRSRSCEAVVRTSRGLGITWRNPPPQSGGRLSHTFSEQRRNGKAQSVRWASRKSAVCAHRLTERRSLSPPLPQNASFREIVPPECAFPYGTGCRMRFSVECAFPHLGKRRAASRKSAFCALDLTEKRSLHVGPHAKAHSVLTASRKGAVCPRHSRRMRLSVRSCRQNALFRTARVAECAFP